MLIIDRTSRNRSSTDNAGIFDDRSKYERTTWMYVQNNTPYAIKLALLQATCRYPLPAPYYSDTGAFVAGTNMAAGASIALDPWDIGGREAPIAATAGNGTIKITDGTQEADVTLSPFPEAAEGEYYPQMGWQLNVQTVTALSGGKFEIVKASRVLSRLVPVRR
jgi:hypothetical protein